MAKVDGRLDRELFVDETGESAVPALPDAPWWPSLTPPGAVLGGRRRPDDRVDWSVDDVPLLDELAEILLGAPPPRWRPQAPARAGGCAGAHQPAPGSSRRSR